MRFMKLSIFICYQIVAIDNVFSDIKNVETKLKQFAYQFEPLNNVNLKQSDSLIGLCNCPPGPPGRLGIMGLPGIPGFTGEKGNIGLPGSPGADNEFRGQPGIKGASGDNGEIGSIGPMGNKGQPGPKGATGRAGVTGSFGQKGDMGPQGEIGSTGLTGIAGAPGLQGERGVSLVIRMKEIATKPSKLENIIESPSIDKLSSVNEFPSGNGSSAVDESSDYDSFRIDEDKCGNKLITIGKDYDDDDCFTNLRSTLKKSKPSSEIYNIKQKQIQYQNVSMNGKIRFLQIIDLN